MNFAIRTVLLRFWLFVAIVAVVVLLNGYRWTYTPYGRLDYGAALVAKILNAQSLTTLSNFLIDNRSLAVSSQPVLLKVDDSSDVLLQQDQSVSAEWGAIPVRIYRPAGTGPFPAVLWIHGGGWMTGSHHVTDGPVISLASMLGLVVVSVDYRLSPENPFPAALKDCYRVLEWMVEQARLLEIDPARIILRGESAGGNLAAAVALMARDRNGPAIHFQILHQPLVDLREDASWLSYNKFGKGYFLDMAALNQSRTSYLSSTEQQTDPYVSPLLAELSDLPAALVSVAEFDPLHDQGEAYAHKLRSAGVDVRLYQSKGALHSLLGSPKKEREIMELERAILRTVLFGGENKA